MCLSRWSPCQIRRSQSHDILPCLDQETGNTTSFTPDQSLFTCLHVIRKECQETINHDYRKNVKEHVVRFVKLNEIKQQLPTCETFTSGCHGASRAPHRYKTCLSFLMFIFGPLTYRTAPAPRIGFRSVYRPGTWLNRLIKLIEVITHMTNFIRLVRC